MRWTVALRIGSTELSIVVYGKSEYEIKRILSGTFREHMRTGFVKIVNIHKNKEVLPWRSGLG